MYHPTTRVLAVLELLQSHYRLTGGEIARRLEVSERTARRYVEMLQDLGIPIEGERGRYGAYRLRPGYRLPPLVLTNEEALAVTLGLLISRRMGLIIAAPAIESVLAKLNRVLPEGVREQVRAIQETLAISVAPSDTPPQSRTIMDFSRAASESRRIWIRYASSEAESEREVDPYGLVYHAGRWYAVGWCHLRRDLRVFRLDRVLETELREESFEPPEGFDVQDFLTRSLATIPGTWEVEVALELEVERARRLIAPTLALLEETDEGVVMRLYVSDLDWMARYLVGLGCRFRVLKPPELLSALAVLADNIRALAEDRQGERS